MISQYNREQPEPIHNLMHVVAKRLTIQGFIIMDHPEIESEFMKEVTKMLLDGKIKYRETVAQGIDKTPEALIDVLQGKNFGKQVVKVADP